MTRAHDHHADDRGGRTDPHRVSDKEFNRLFLRWVTFRYGPLMGPAFAFRRPRQWWFQIRLRRAGRRAPARVLNTLLDDGRWRAQLTVVWLIAAGRREDMRPRISHELLTGSGGNFSVALACLGTEEDALLLSEYLRTSLSLTPGPGHDHACQNPIQAMGALLYLDRELGTQHAQPFLGVGGLWEMWPGSEGASLPETEQSVREDVLFAAGKNPGTRRRIQQEG